MSDREEAGLRGPVKTCIEESTFSNRDSVLLIRREYSLAGDLLTARVRNPDGSEFVTTHAYNPEGRLVKITSGNSSEVASEIVYVYDDAGRSLSITNTGSNDRTDFQYDELGRKTGIQRFDPKSIERSRSCAFGGSAWDAAMSGSGVPLGGSIITTYDENDRPVEAQIRDAEDHIVSRIVRAYNAAGLIIEERPILENPALMFLDRLPAGEEQPNPAQLQALNKGFSTLMSGRAQIGTLHTYDAHNRVTTVHERNYVFEKTTTIVYNDHGDRTEEHSTISDNSVVPVGVAFSIEDDGSLTPSKPDVEPPTPVDLPQRSEVRYAYQYDDHGNWTQQTTNFGPSSDSPSSVRNRKLTYY